MIKDLNYTCKIILSGNKLDVLFIIGDWNAKVGSEETPGVTGKFGLGIWNEAGQRLIEFGQENSLVIANILFQQHKRSHPHLLLKSSHGLWGPTWPGPCLPLQISLPILFLSLTLLQLVTLFLAHMHPQVSREILFPALSSLRPVYRGTCGLEGDPKWRENYRLHFERVRWKRKQFSGLRMHWLK